MKLFKNLILSVILLLNISLNSIQTQSLNFTKQKVLNGHSSTVDSLIKLNDNEIATGSFDSTVKIWDLKDDRVQYTLSGHSTAIYSLEKLDDILIASGSADRTIRIWDYTNGALIQTLTDNSNFVLSLASLNDSFFLSGSSGFFATIKLWSTIDWKVKKTINTPQAVRKLNVLNPNQIAVANDDFKIRTYNLNSGEIIYEMSGHSSYIRALIQLNENEIISGSDDKTIKLWNTKEGSLVRTLVTLTGPIRSLLSFNDQYIVAGLGAFSKNLVLINRANNWYPFIESYLEGHSSTVTSLVQLNINQFASVSDDKAVIVWQSFSTQR